ncbi:MAG TPA: cytochrome c [Gemmata sp.]
MKRCVFAVALFGAGLLVAASVTAEEPTKAATKLTKKDITKLMKEAHVGAKSPHARTLEELKKEAPNWDQVSKDAKAFVAMGEAFKKTELGYTSPTKYIEAATALNRAAGAKDTKAANAAFTGLSKSCSGCHGYGSPTGTGK